MGNRLHSEEIATGVVSTQPVPESFTWGCTVELEYLVTQILAQATQEHPCPAWG